MYCILNFIFNITCLLLISADISLILMHFQMIYYLLYIMTCLLIFKNIDIVFYNVFVFPPDKLT